MNKIWKALTDQDKIGAYLLVAAAVIVVIALSACGHYQPPGQDLWRML